MIVLLAATGALVGKFIILGETLPSTDGRTAIIVEPGERDLILEEMRSFLVSVQAIVASANADEIPDNWSSRGPTVREIRHGPEVDQAGPAQRLSHRRRPLSHRTPRP